MLTLSQYHQDQNRQARRLAVPYDGENLFGKRGVGKIVMICLDNLLPFDMPSQLAIKAS